MARTITEYDLTIYTDLGVSTFVGSFRSRAAAAAEATRRNAYRCEIARRTNYA